ncbi:DNA polymerase III subunit gamma/tau [Thalassoglobus sp. JC818]|uniref:DNA polymerase III subunit gamma/tau n=1 Tax=Thalassoglobus sp. JC818 TaxID=3232136 RepID=UPI00345900DA
MVSEPSRQYTVLARRFRPQSFDQVVGQEHVGQAIRNAIRMGRVAHAYLFTGARGVGKTSTARIFAKALNCPNVVDGVPCNNCDVCKSIGEGTDVDVLEIDGASNRRIDDIRELRSNVNVKSMRSKSKVYIIDEVHMLTKEAFNALLKTLEEPPPNVKFIFCTTEPNKVPDTILSRCQRFDFGTIDETSIAGRLRQIAEAEGKEVDDEAIELVARRAAGSMRDSQSLFDQLLAFGGEQITAKDVHQLMGTAPDQRLVDLVNGMIERDTQRVLTIVDEALLQGVQIGSLSDQLLAYFRDLLVTVAGASTVSLSSVSEATRSELVEQSKKWGLETITAAMQIISETKSKMQRVNHGRALLELAVIRVAMLEDLTSIAALARQVASGTAVVSQTAERRPSGPVSRAISSSQREQNSKKNGSSPENPPSYETPPQSAPEPTASDQPQLTLSEGTLDQVWEQVMENVPDTIRNHLKNAVSIAISGPNVLEILFPNSYLFSKSYCERTDPLKKLSEVVLDLTGESVTFRFQVDRTAKVELPKPKKVAAPHFTERRNPAVVDEDDFVQAAVSMFGGQVVEVRPVFTKVADDSAEGEMDV